MARPEKVQESNPQPAELDRAEKARLLRELRGSTAGGPSLTDDLLRERREEEARSKW